MTHLGGIEAAEGLSLVLALIGYFIFIVEFINHKNLLHLFLAYTLLLVGAVATVLETFYLGSFLNYVEHVVGMALAGIAFALTAFLSHRKITGIDKTIKHRMRMR